MMIMVMNDVDVFDGDDRNEEKEDDFHAACATARLSKMHSNWYWLVSTPDLTQY